MDNIDFAEIAKTLGGVIAFALVLYVGVIFYRREANFSAEYEMLIDQYKERNQELLAEIDDLRNLMARASEQRALEIKKLQEEIRELTNRFEGA